MRYIHTFIRTKGPLWPLIMLCVRISARNEARLIKSPPTQWKGAYIDDDVCR